MPHASQHRKKLPGVLAGLVSRRKQPADHGLATLKPALPVAHGTTSWQIIVHKCARAAIIARRTTDACQRR
jgi:hypothetical protein